jgi:hypothetical protein
MEMGQYCISLSGAQYEAGEQGTSFLDARAELGADWQLAFLAFLALNGAAIAALHSCSTATRCH